MKYVVVDLDGTLCDIAHRVHHAQAGQWEDFHRGLSDDGCFEHIAILMSDLDFAGRPLIVVTGRPEEHRERTLQWFKQNGVAHLVHDMLMRPTKDWVTKDSELKLRLLDEYFGGRDNALANVLFCLDDRDRVVQGYRDAGFKCLQVAEGDY